MSTKPDKPVEPRLETVTLLRAHTHEGTLRQEGETIVVNATDKQWLSDNGIIPTPATPATN
ncbi:hypothetical protein D9M71_278880 [compost metagenome]